MSIQKIPFSGSTHGRGIKVAASATPGTTIHTAQAAATDGAGDELWAFVTNTDSVDRKVTFELGGTTAPDDNVTMIVPAGETIPVLTGQMLRNSLVLKAFGAAADVLVVTGYINRIS